jgi:hypothetical protein
MAKLKWNIHLNSYILINIVMFISNKTILFTLNSLKPFFSPFPRQPTHRLLDQDPRAVSSPSPHFLSRFSLFLSLLSLSLSLSVSMPIVRRAEIEDAREFNALVNQLGGPNVFRAQFGQYNFTSLIEYSHLALFSPTDDGSCGCFASFSDGILSVGDNLSFDQIITTLSDLIPCRV